MSLKPEELAPMIDHTLLKPDATSAQVEQICAEARQYGFASVCVNPTHVHACAELLKDAHPVVCTVIGFPLGASAPIVKSYETEIAIEDGADEIDMVINIGALKDGNDQLVLDDITGVVETAHSKDKLVKVIIETCLLTDEEKERACKLAKEANADFVKTSTGFAGGGATVEDIALMRRVVGPKVGVKASGGVRSYEDAVALVEAGATRLGASAGVKIMQGQTSEGSY
jgi:deoxyribose-phosphate aldolase